MIRTLALQNWRAYKHVRLNFDPGTTFVVAANGVGKSSLLEAARWAICGEVLPTPESAIRVGTQEASVEVELELPHGETLWLRRVLTRPRARVLSTVEATLEGKRLSGSELTRVLEDSLKANMLFVSRTAFLSEDLRREEDPDLIGQLSRAFGIDDLLRARQELVIPIRELAGALKSARSEESASAADLDRVENELAEAINSEKAAEDALKAARAQMEQASRVLRDAEMALRDADRLRSWRQKMVEIRDLAEPLIGPVEFDGLPTALEASEIRARDALADSRHRRALLLGRIQSVEESLAKLHDTDAACPVCRRPLTEDDRAHAEDGHAHELQALRAQHAVLDDAGLEQEHKVVDALLKRVLALGDRPQTADLGADQLESAKGQARIRQDELEEALRQHQREQARRSALEQQRSEIRNKVNSELATHSSYRELALAEAAQGAIDIVVSRALDQYIAPLTQEIRRRWKHLFADRPDLQIEPSGELTRRMEGYDLPFEAFSAGEQSSARLLLRLVSLTTATAARFCWIDEPLEHLDPTTRRLTAGMLARGAGTSGIRQLVVTTFEEELAGLLERTSDDVHLLHVRTRRSN